MKLEQLVHTVEVAGTQSISKAATNLLMSQPGLSASIKQLEIELGGDLFIRNKKGVELTPMGSNFVSYARKILDQVNSLERLCKENTSQIYQTLSVAACHFRFAGAATAMLMNRHRDDGARFVFRNGVAGDCIDWVAEGICDIGLVYFDSDLEKDFKKMIQLKQLRYGTIYQTEARAIIGKGHPLYHTDATEIDAQELLKYPMIAHDQTTAKDYFRSVFLHTKNDNLRAIITDRGTLYEMLEFSDGYCMGLSNDIVYSNIPRQPSTRDLKIRESSTPMRRSVAWIASANVDFMPLAKEFIDLITALCTDPDFASHYPNYTTQK